MSTLRERILNGEIEEPPPCQYCGRLVLAGVCCSMAVRIPQLTALAKRAFSDDTAQVIVDNWHGEFYDLKVVKTNTLCNVVCIEILNILTPDMKVSIDALEAALRVLAARTVPSLSAFDIDEP